MIKNNGTKYLFFLDGYFDEICKSKAIVDIATAGKDHGFSSFHIRHNLFDQSTLGRDVEHHNTHIVLFKYTPDVMQVSTLSAQMGLASELVEWYRDSVSVA